jgi:hypothetical protein
MSTVLVTPARKGTATHEGRSGGGGSGRSEHNHHIDTLGAIAITQRITFLLLDRRESWLLHDCPLLRGVWARREDPCSRNWLAQERELTFFKICDDAGDGVIDILMDVLLDDRHVFLQPLTRGVAARCKASELLRRMTCTEA